MHVLYCQCFRVYQNCFIVDDIMSIYSLWVNCKCFESRSSQAHGISANGWSMCLQHTPDKANSQYQLVSKFLKYQM